MTTPIQDERDGKPSGSNAFRWLTCQGSHLAQQGLPDDSGDDAAEGDLLHAIIAGKREPIDISEDQAAVVTFALHERDKLASQLLGEVAEIVDKDQTRYWLRNGDLEPIASCKLDFIARAGSKMLVIDYKFGRREVDSADTNAQLRFAAAVCWQEFRPEELFVAIIQPRAEVQRVTVASYDANAMESALMEMIDGAQIAMLPGRTRKPSTKACHYCRAKGTERCPESVAEVTALAAVNTAEIATPEQLAVLLDRCDLVDDVVKAIRSEAKRRMDAGEKVPGWRMKPGNIVKKITDPVAAWAKVGKEIGGSAFAECCTVSLPDMAKAWQKQFTKKSEKEARAEIEEILAEAGAITEKQNAPSLAREVKAA